MNGARRLQFNMNVLNDSSIRFCITFDPFLIHLNTLCFYYSPIANIRSVAYPMFWGSEVSMPTL